MLSNPTFDLSDAEIGKPMTSRNVADKKNPPDTLSVTLTLYILNTHCRNWPLKSVKMCALMHFQFCFQGEACYIKQVCESILNIY